MYVLLTVVTVLLMCQQQQQMNMAIATRLPLEVYELVPHSTQQQHEIHQLQHDPDDQQIDITDATAKKFEYAIISNGGDKVAATTTKESAKTPPTRGPATTTNTKTSSDSSRRTPATITKGRATADLVLNQRAGEDTITNALNLSDEQQHQHQQQQIQRKSRQMLQKQQHNIRILYQVGESEADLPICAPNAVCSKIDLYETPWIERQCRCPEVSRSPEIILHHHSTLHSGHGHNHASINTYVYGHSSSHHIQLGLPHQTSANIRQLEKYRSFYEREKAQQQQDNRLLVTHGDIRGASAAADKYDNVHLKKLMHKLGAVYEDDLHLQASYGDMDAPLDSAESQLEGAANDVKESSKAQYNDLLMNDFPKAAGNAHHVYGENTAHKRHSAHNMANKLAAADASLSIGGCPSGLGVEDGHTIADKTRHYKMCQPVHKLPVCKYFRDYTWTLKTSSKLNVTEQIVHCRCPKNSVTYLTKRDPAEDGSNQYTYLFACSPVTRIRCQRKQPCKLFTVRKRQEFLDEVNINALCQCPKGHHCPSHHTQSGVIPGESFLEDNIQTYSGYCMAND